MSCDPSVVRADMHLLVNGNDLIKFVDDAQLRIKGLSTSVYVDPHKVRRPALPWVAQLEHKGAAGPVYPVCGADSCWGSLWLGLSRRRA